MLRNNKEREQYFADPTHWHQLKCGDICPNDVIRVEKLYGYPIIAIKSTVVFREPQDVILAYYQISYNHLNALHDVYSKTYKQCIAIMKETDNE